MLTNETISKLNEMHLGTMAAGYNGPLVKTTLEEIIVNTF